MKKKMVKQIMAWVLVFMLGVGVLPAKAFAEEISREGAVEEAEIREEAPAAKTEAEEAAPAEETEAEETAPVAETEAEDEAPAAESEAEDEAPAEETEAEDETPAAETEIAEEVSAVESETEEAVPAAENETEEAGPAAETETQDEFPAMKAETEETAPAVKAEKQMDAPVVREKVKAVQAEMKTTAAPTAVQLPAAPAEEAAPAAPATNSKVEAEVGDFRVEHDGTAEYTYENNELVVTHGSLTVSNKESGAAASDSIFVNGSNISLTLRNLLVQAIKEAAIRFAQAAEGEADNQATLIIEGEVDLSSKKNAIEVRQGTALTIEGAGGKDGSDSLTVTGTGKHGAGIGYYGSEDAGNITIRELAAVVATGGVNGEGGVGIGGGRKDSAENGSIVIENVGSVTAKGGEKAAAIGGGFWRGVSVRIENVDELQATGGKTAAAIGSSRNAIQGDEANPTNPALITEIEIINSTVTAVGGENGAAIGSGASDRLYGDYSRVDSNKATGESFVGSDAELPEVNIRISGNSLIDATGGKYAAAIGGGYKVYAANINIGSGVTVVARAGDNGGNTDKSASAIGAGADGSSIYSAKSGSLFIEAGAKIMAFGFGFDLIEGKTDKAGALSNRWALAREAATENTGAAVVQGRFLTLDQLNEEAGHGEEIGELRFYDRSGAEEDRTVTFVNLIDGSAFSFTLPRSYTGFAVSLPVGSYQLLINGEPWSFLESEGYSANTDGSVTGKAQLVYGDETVEQGSYADYLHSYQPYGSSSDTVELHYAYGAPSANFDVVSGINLFDALARRLGIVPEEREASIEEPERQEALEESEENPAPAVNDEPEEAPAEKNTPVEEAPVEEAPVEEAPVEEAPVEKTSVEEKVSVEEEAAVEEESSVSDKAPAEEKIPAVEVVSVEEESAPAAEGLEIIEEAAPVPAAMFAVPAAPAAAAAALSLPGIPAAALSAADEIEEAATPLAAFHVEEIPEPEAPLGAPEGGSWALFNLICAILTVLIGLLMSVSAAAERHEEQGTEKASAGKLLSLVPAAAAVVTFLLTENMRLPMQLIDRWSILMLALLAIGAALALVVHRGEQKDVTVR